MPGADAASRAASPLAGFWMGGYEGADHVNGQGQPLDMSLACGHVHRLEEDHRRAAQAGLRGVRESIGWRLSEAAGGAIDLSRALRIQASATRHGLQPVWTLMHYGLPADLCLHDDALVPRLVRFAREVARTLRPGSAQAPVYNVVNEISYTAWAAAEQGHLFPPNGLPTPEQCAREPALGRAYSSGYEVKRRLARAALLAMRAIREEDPRARFLNVEPLVHVVAPPDRPDLQARAALERNWQWQAWDMLAGKLEPELGGGPQWLDLVGVNYYHVGQWEVQTARTLQWHLRDPRRLPLHCLLRETWQRYRMPLVLAETSHVGVGRAAWLHEVACEVRTAGAQGVPVQGLCLYPLVDRPDWQLPGHWHRSGLWHVDAAAIPSTAPPPQRATGQLPRHAEPAVHAALRAWQAHLPQPGAGGQRAPPVLMAYAGPAWNAGGQRLRHRLRTLVARFPGWRVVIVDLGTGAAEQPGRAALDHQPQGPLLDVLLPGGFGVPGAPGWNDRMARALAGWLQAQRLHQHLAWLESPRSWDLAQALHPQRVLGDAVEEDEGVLVGDRAESADAGHRAATDEWQAACFRRGAAAARAGGWAAFEARSLLPAGAGPMLGYAGPIDARLDLHFVAALAAARPDWQWVFVGPLQGVEAAALPRASNLHWLGDQPQALLPALMAQWQLGVVPRRPWPVRPGVLPAAVAEPLATGLAVVTSLVLAPARSLPALQHTVPPSAFIRACERALGMPAVALAPPARPPVQPIPAWLGSTPRRPLVRGVQALLLAGCMSALNAQPFVAGPSAPVSGPSSNMRVAAAQDGLSREAQAMLDWVRASADNQVQPFAIIDKRQARLWLFDQRGQLTGSTPVLLGSAHGDHSVPGIGERPMAQIQPHERTTPAGRFVAEVGRNAKGEDIFWIDYDAAVSLHRVRAHVPSERRLQRLASATPWDNRISYGCINVPVNFYEQSIEPAFSSGRAVVYVLPETAPLSALFPLPRNP